MVARAMCAGGRARPVVERTGGHGWNAYLTTDEDGPAEVVIYCIGCAEREFAR
jgi:hypothetical protein